VNRRKSVGRGTINTNLLSSGKMQCSSCHDVHNSAGVLGLLRKSNAGSALCLTCHHK
jgi:predicted CXXCH cytochrome family protein